MIQLYKFSPIHAQIPLWQKLFHRLMFVIIALGVFVSLMFLAFFALFIFLGLCVIGLVFFVGMWIHSKLTGKPLFSRTELNSGNASTEVKGIILETRKTPQGWQIDI